MVRYAIRKILVEDCQIYGIKYVLFELLLGAGLGIGGGIYSFIMIPHSFISLFFIFFYISFGITCSSYFFVIFQTKSTTIPVGEREYTKKERIFTFILLLIPLVGLLQLLLDWQKNYLFP